MEDYRQTRQYQTDIADLLRPDVQRALGQVHDYKAFVSTVITNLNVIWHERFGMGSIEDHLARASREEVAIYHAARLMEGRLDAALFLTYPERITDLRICQK